MSDLLFGNNNKRVVWRLARRNLVASKMRNIFVISAITLTTLLLTTIFSLGISFVESSRLQLVNMMGTVAHANINANKLTQQQLDMCTTLDYVKAVGVQTAVATIDNHAEWGKKSQLYLFEYDETEWTTFRKPVFTNLVGQYPQRVDEIMAPVAMLEYMGITSPQLGMKIPIEYLYGSDETTRTSQTFVLSGYFTEQVIAGQIDYGFMLISSAFAKPCLEKNPLVLGQVSFQFTDGSSTQAKIQQLEQDLALQVGSIQPTLPIVDNQVSSILAIVLVVLFIMLMGYLLIYNVLYLSISRDIRFYGLLKALGTTAKQIRKIVVSQALLLSGIGIVLGLVLGGYLSILFVPTVMASTVLQKATTASTNPLIFLGAAVFSLITVVLSTRKPAAMAAKITPIAAMKYTENAVYHNHKKTSFGVNLMLMAWRNVFREQKRAKTVLISLSLGITVFLVTSSLLSSMDLKNFVKSSLQHDFELQNTTINKEVGNELLDKFDENVIEEIQKIPSIQNLTMITSDLYTVAYDEEQFSQHIDDYLSRFPYYTSKKSDYGQGNLYGALLGIDSAIVIEFNKKTANPVDLVAFEKGEIALIETNNPEHFVQVDRLDCTVRMSNEKISLSLGWWFYPLGLSKHPNTRWCTQFICF